MSTTTVPAPPPWLGAPGVSPVPLRPLSVGEVLDGGMDLLRRHPGPTLGVSAATVTLQLLITVPLWWAVTSLLDRAGTSASGGATILLVLVTLTAASVVGSLGTTVTAVLTTASTAVAMGLEAAGEPAPLASVWARLRPQLPRLLLLALTLTGINALFALIPLAGFVILLLGGVMRLSVLAVVFERASIGTALRRGFQIGGSGGGMARQMGIRLLAALVSVLVWLMAFLPLSALVSGVASALGAGDLMNDGGGGTLLFLASLAIAYYLPLVAVWAFRSGVDTMLYLDGRMRGEALDVEWGLAARLARSRRRVLGGVR